MPVSDFQKLRCRPTVDVSVRRQCRWINLSFKKMISFFFERECVGKRGWEAEDEAEAERERKGMSLQTGSASGPTPSHSFSLRPCSIATTTSTPPPPPPPSSSPSPAPASAPPSRPVPSALVAHHILFPKPAPSLLPALQLCHPKSPPLGVHTHLLPPMALRSAAAQAATLLRLSSRPASHSLWVPLARRFHSTRFASSDEVRPGLHYAESHEWVKVDGDIGVVGITDHAQKALGDLVFVELPEPGTSITHNSKFGSVESVKAVSDVNSPVSGEVVEFNNALTDDPSIINSSPYEDGWLIKVKLSDKSEVGKLMTPEKYTTFQDAGH